MSSPYLYATWLSAPSDEDTAKVAADFVAALGSTPGVVQTAAYRLTVGGPAMQKLAGVVKRIDDERFVAAAPRAVVLAELDSLATSAEVGDRFGARDDAPEPDPVAASIAWQVLFHELSYVSGPEESSDPSFGPAIQLGALNVDSLQAEWELNQWYERVRLPAVATMPGQIRTRRYVSIAGPPRYGVLYEFLSLDARIKGFEEREESHGLDRSHPTSKLMDYTVHAPGAPFIGERLEPAGS